MRGKMRVKKTGREGNKDARENIDSKCIKKNMDRV